MFDRHESQEVFDIAVAFGRAYTYTAGLSWQHYSLAPPFGGERQLHWNGVGCAVVSENIHMPENEINILQSYEARHWKGRLCVDQCSFCQFSTLHVCFLCGFVLPKYLSNNYANHKIRQTHPSKHLPISVNMFCAWVINIQEICSSQLHNNSQGWYIVAKSFEIRETVITQ